MTHEPIQTEAAPQAIGPYSQAIKAGTMLFCSGQIGIDPATGDLVSEEVGGQTRRVLSNLSAVLDASGFSLRDVVKTTVYLTRLSEFRAMNEIYSEFFGGSPPARSTVEVSALPMQAAVEIEAFAVKQ